MLPKYREAYAINLYFKSRQDGAIHFLVLQVAINCRAEYSTAPEWFIRLKH